ncbi:MAG: tetratricopeptide repeat protein [Vagococcus sp.]
MSNSKKMLEAISSGDLAGAQLAFEKAQREDLPEERIQLADNLFQLGFIDEASTLFEQLLNEFPEEDSLKISLAEIAIENDELEQAFTWLEAIEESSPIYPQSLLTQADIYQLLNIPEVSEQKLFRAKELLPNEPLIELSLAELYFASEDYQRAIETYEAILRDFSDFESPVQLDERIGVALSRIGEFEHAIAHLEKAIEAEETVDRLFQLALTYYQVNENERAIDLLNQVKLMDEEFLQVYYPLGQILHDEGRFEEAIEVVEEGISENPYETALYHLASETAYSLNLKDEAKSYLEEVISLEVETDFSKLKLAELLLKEEEFEDVITLLHSLENMDHPFVYWYLAQANNGLEEFELAKQNYLKAKDALLDGPDFLKDYGVFLREDGDLEESTRLLSHYLTLVPGDLDILTLIENN